MKSNMLDYTREEISRFADDRLQAEWRDYMAFSTQRQRLREEVQRMMRKKSPAQAVKAGEVPEGGMIATKSGPREILLAKKQSPCHRDPAWATPRPQAGSHQSPVCVGVAE